MRWNQPDSWSICWPGLEDRWTEASVWRIGRWRHFQHSDCLWEDLRSATLSLWLGHWGCRWGYNSRCGVSSSSSGQRSIRWPCQVYTRPAMTIVMPRFTNTICSSKKSSHILEKGFIFKLNWMSLWKYTKRSQNSLPKKLINTHTE